METPYTLWCQWSTAGRLHNKSHCVFPSLHLETGSGAWWWFFYVLVRLWTGSVWKNMSNMVMCSLNLWTAKRSLQLVHNIVSNSSVLFLCASTEVYQWKSTTEETITSENVQVICLWHLDIFLSLCLGEVSEEPCFFLPISLFIMSFCRVGRQATCTHVTLHFSSYMFITAIQVNSNRLAGVWQSVH